MKRIGFVLLGSLLALPGCQRDDTGIRKEVAELKDGQKAILAKLDKLPAQAGAARPQRPQRPQRPRPMPNDVYSVNIDGSAYRGAKDAKVTIVEAFEFA